MSDKEFLDRALVSALKASGGSASIGKACEAVWEQNENELRLRRELFFTWQYDIRWSAHWLRLAGVLRSASLSPQGVWELTYPSKAS